VRKVPKGLVARIIGFDSPLPFALGYRHHASPDGFDPAPVAHQAHGPEQVRSIFVEGEHSPRH
jgi:hypothetical protein